MRLRFDKIKYNVPDMEKAIEENVTGFRAERNRDILKMRFLAGATISEIAEAFDMSDIQISRILARYGEPILLMFVK